ncbi:anaerobic ribonucleoside-triphosphate reductase activating protein [Chitinophaga terrae (ex Kim and Jung 2007)]|uniref:Anaerobic ribonucleoside-triphosphate reductase activating protein n=1 Tax=Chitinophaga terrae (ex Kim and Jung 2007) TaxID=408074 RepID=A0A1H4CIE4_9BACT|nr:4Fe-4S single cluster domain-containing protein [Chitinophaga terrae (ex Kim and Jung 2007)]GEP88997.1 anaerobic ribonucleoside-triphosphate reductase-activating protein [Chitinophaga terrae (ex Kim and Jung 2007)]SEA60124.1 anaerobic ribonucleoside-triphosphate reductase activating protein [Chitinophaga terrae (ex Kim and Jung 2007)]
MELYINEFIPVTAVEGPGLRACLWVQGCSIRCDDCMVPHTWDRKKGKVADTSALLQILRETPGIEGLTVLGGEPMDQAPALLPFLEQVKASGLSLMLFSGYTREAILASGCPYKAAIIDLCDIFIDGPYVKDLTSFDRPWVGSGNQRIFFQTERYRHLENNLHTIENKVEIRITDEGEIAINGMMPKEKFIELQRSFRKI